MNIQFIDDIFLLHFSNGLDDEQFIELGKKHKSSKKIVELASQFNLSDLLEIDNYHLQKNTQFIVKLVSSSSIISVFEKVAFKNYIADPKIQPLFFQALYYYLSDLNNNTMQDFIEVLNLKNIELNKRLATWPLVTFFLVYFDECNEIFIKPTTIKKLAKLLEYPLNYESKPSYEMYLQVKDMIYQFKNTSKLVNKDSSNIIVQAIMYSALDI